LSAAHILVLLASIVSIFRGLRSRALLADLDEIVSAVAVVSFLSLVLEAMYCLRTDRDGAVAPGSQQTSARHWPRWLQASLGLAAGVSLGYLESLPLPNARTEAAGESGITVSSRDVL
jgi:hypothetical protein